MGKEMIKLAWGLSPDVPVEAAWGARAIYKLGDRSADIEGRIEMEKPCRSCGEVMAPGEESPDYPGYCRWESCEERAKREADCACSRGGNGFTCPCRASEASA